MATSDKTTIVIEKQPDGKMRVTSDSWDGEKVVFEGSDAQGAARDRRRSAAWLAKPRHRTSGTHRSRRYDPYGPGNAASDEFIDY